MSKHINTHLFFHLNDHSTSSGKSKSGGGIDASSPRKPAKKSSNLFSGYEIDNNPPLPIESGDYYDYYTNYGIPEYHGPFSPPGSPSYYGEEPLSNYEYKNNEYYNNNRDYYENGDTADYRNNETIYAQQTVPHYPLAGRSIPQQPVYAPMPEPSVYGRQTSNTNTLYPTNNLTSKQLSSSASNLYDARRASPTSPPTDQFAYRSEHQQGLSAISHKLHRITFVEACIFQPPELTSPSGSRPLPGAPNPTANSSIMGPIPAVPPRPTQPPLSMPPPPTIAQGERSPTSTGGTQYYQEWTSKHMRHLCGRFEKPTQQQLLMNVERKSKYPFIILCTPEATARSGSLSKSSSSASSNKPPHYRRELSHHSVYLNEDDISDDDNDNEESRWITQKQRDSINHHYLPPPPPPLLMPHIWPEIRYIDGLYTVCASVTRPGSGMPEEPDDSFSLEVSPYQRSVERHISFQDDRNDSHSLRSGMPTSDWRRPSGYIVSGFATFPGEDSERLERNWLMWTGARILYKYLPESVGLRRMIFLKRCPDMYREENQNKMKPTIFTGFTYVLLCECFNLRNEFIASVCTTIDQLRARCCGYSALYLTHFQQGQQQQQGLPQTLHQQQQQQPQHHHSHHAQPHHQMHPNQQQFGVQGNHFTYEQQHSTSSASNSSGHSQPSVHIQSVHHHPHHIPRHHRSQEFTDFG